MQVGHLVVKVLLISVLPVLFLICGLGSDGLVLGLSGFVIVVQLVCPSTRSKKNARGAQCGFPIQLAFLYLLQVWIMVLSRTSVRAEAFSGDSAKAMGSRQSNVAPPKLSESMTKGVPDLFGGDTGLANAQKLRGAEAPVVPRGRGQAVALAPAPAKPLASETDFELDAPPELLRWTPKTISVVLPCAEEREYALKTVKSVFSSTPPDILHEIVVVDDGSNPPLSETHLKPDIQKMYKVKIMRHQETVGLIGAKKTGGDGATGDLVVFFDCHVAPQQNWYKDFLELISENYRRMVVPSITGLNIDTWTQYAGGGLSKCYLTWDGDFKWGGTDDMYMGMISGGLAGMSKRWWTESGGFDSQMFGWGGENIDQGIRMWVCGGEIVAAPHAEVAHMWRAGDPRTSARYRHVGDSNKNRARAMFAWYGEFAKKLDDYPAFANRDSSWYGDLSSYQEVKKRLKGCHPFAWYLKRFKAVYEDAGLIPKDIFMLKQETTGKCLFFQGRAGTSGFGSEGVILKDCDPKNDRFFWHLANRDRRSGKCCSSLRAWNTDQCFEGHLGANHGKGKTAICELSGRSMNQHWAFTSDGRLKHGKDCFGLLGNNELQAKACSSFAAGEHIFQKEAAREPIETTLYLKSQQEHPEIFTKLNAKLAEMEAAKGPHPCLKPGSHKCVQLMQGGKCLDADAEFVPLADGCAYFHYVDEALHVPDTNDCLDTWSDNDASTWGFYVCHGGRNQKFGRQADRLCNLEKSGDCFDMRDWSPQP